MREKNEKIFGPEDLKDLTPEQVIKLYGKQYKNEKKEKKKKIVKFQHYYVENPESELTIKTLTLTLKNGHTYIFKAPSGVYGKKEIDKATKVLLENIEITGKKILDIGCGYGIIGITLKKEYPDIEIYMSDINKRAVEFSKINSKNNNIFADIRQGNLFEPWNNEIFDQIVSNPPIVAGKKIWMKLIEDSFLHLKKDGSLQLVAFHNKGGSRIKNYMNKIFGNVSEVVKKGGIRLYKSVKV
ncbi:16S rRNA m(2)G 1207 methyltransferase [Marinitoga hydrogenitolerans DSM 16785]|uniref:16S rRNA m(2)G 1207 methyltransferase n=1 Tax=Marinitoga hydrogenitolerans (strain DSM 16785 / JCM 12826 / AT1271) TaxID=1122195 RepID=A0A1M4TZB8_MARH1|nr:methyltransferase [Marinitoga hydrogenitolerans]SHE49862.1 16S rRNA m(2)G 1207 methyltransferase [Marinitoga hydrogenitolerans DSM 16785]